MFLRLKHFTYEKRLDRLRFVLPLDVRPKRDLLEVCNIVRSTDKVVLVQPLDMESLHSQKLCDL